MNFVSSKVGASVGRKLNTAFIFYLECTPCEAAGGINKGFFQYFCNINVFSQQYGIKMFEIRGKNSLSVT